MVTDDSAAAPVMPARRMLTLLGVLAALPLVPFGVLAARDWVYAQLHLVNNETPQGWLPRSAGGPHWLSRLCGARVRGVPERIRGPASVPMLPT